MPSVEDRLTRLERSARRWRAVAVCAVLLLPLLGLDKLTPDELRTRRLVIVNDEGAEIATLGREAKGVTALIVRTADNKSGGVIEADADGAMVHLTDEAHRRSTMLSADVASAAVTFIDKAADTQLVYGPSVEGSLVWGRYKGGSLRWWLRADP